MYNLCIGITKWDIKAQEKPLSFSIRKEELSLKNKRLKIARIEHDLSQEQLGERVGVTRQTVSMIESGNYNPTLNLCIAICKELGKTLDELFWEVSE